MDPLVFVPYLRPRIWGGRGLGDHFGKDLPTADAYGESWEISGHPQHVSRVAEGPFKGVLLNDLCARHGRELFGNGPSRFPLLIKLLDCQQMLSIQVHPDDDKAARLLPGEAGKTEAWIVLDVRPEGRIYAGLLPGTTRTDLERHLEKGTVDQCLYSFVPKKGDCLFFPAGTVHGVGGGVFLAEVQQSSDATFRLFDWNRVGPDGKPRPLHLAQALESIAWDRGPVGPVVPTPIEGLSSGVRGEHLVVCPYFFVDRYYLDGPLNVPPFRMSLWMVLEGSAELKSTGPSASYRRLFRRGETVLIPARAPELAWNPAGPPAIMAGIGWSQQTTDP